MPPSKKSDNNNLKTRVGLTYVDEYVPLETNISFSLREKAVVQSKKRKLPSTLNSTEHKLEEKDNPLTYTPRSNITPKLMGSYSTPWVKSTKWSGPTSRAQPNADELQEITTLNSVWPPDHTPILGQITATPCQHQSKPLFVFNLSIEAVNRNFMLLKHKFGIDLQKALLAQQNCPLGYR